MRKLRTLSACALAAAGLATSSFGQIQVAGTLEVNVDATGQPVGPFNYLTNNGAMGGAFIAFATGSNATTQVIPQIVALGGNGTKGVLLDGAHISLRHFTDATGTTVKDMTSVPGLIGTTPVFSVEAWMYKATITAETGPVAWGNRNVAGQNISCNWGRNFSYGGFSFQGGGYDHGWNTVPPAGVWHHLVWTYDGPSGNLLNLYRDGVLDKAAFQSAAVYVDGTNNIWLGLQHNGSGSFGNANGILGKVRIHSGVLTPAQVANNYSVEAASFVNGTAAPSLASGPIHRYSFNQPVTNNAIGLTVADTGTAPAAAAVVKGWYTNANASFDGDHLNLAGGSSASAPYVDLPNLLLSPLSSSNGGPGQVTFEMWVNPTGQTWSRLMDFGTNTATSEIVNPGGSFNGRAYFTICAQVNTDQEHSRVDVVNAGGAGSTFDLGSRMVADTLRGASTYTHYVATWDEASNVINVYNNGAFVGTYNVAFKMNAIFDVNNWLGRSAWSGDQNMGGGFREFRMYNRVLSAAEVRRNYLTGPADTLDTTALAWNGNAGGTWDTSALNWLAGATSVNFTNGASVILDDSATGTTSLSLSGTVSPKSVAVGNATKDYTISGTGKISGTGGLSKGGPGTLTFAGTQLNDYTGPTLLDGGKTVVSVLANGGSPSALGAATSDPSNLDLRSTLSYQGSPVSIDRGILLSGPVSTIDVLNSLTLSGKVQGAGQGGFAKTGPGTLIFANTVSNMLSGGAGPGFNVVQGTVIFDGTASGGTQTNRNTGELWVGGTTAYGANMVMSNSTLLQDTWFGIGRGNGSVGNLSTMRMENSRVIVAANGLAMGYNPGYLTNYSLQSLTLNGNSQFYIPGEVHVGESVGSSATINVNGTSWLRGNRVLLGQNAGTTGSVTIANSAIITNTPDWTSIGTAAATTTAPGGAGTMVIKDNGAFYSASDFNVSDVGATAGGSVGELDMLNSATLYTGNFFVGKGANCVGVLNQSGGTIFVGGTAYVGNTAGSQGTLNISGGSLAPTNPANNVIIGNAGTGTLNLSGTGTVNATNNLIIGNASGGAGTVNLDGGTLITKRIYMNDPTANSFFNFNGGTLRAADGANQNFLSGLASVTVGTGNAVIDSGANSITIGQDIYAGGAGGLTKLGTGYLKLSGYTYYSGPTMVNAGKLDITTLASGNSSYTIADGANLGVQVVGALNGTVGMPSLTVGSATGASIDLDLNYFGNPTTAPVTVSGAVTASGTSTINIGILSVLSPGEIPLVQYGSMNGAFTLGTLPPGVFAYISNSTASSSWVLVITNVTLPRWEGLAGGTWDVGQTTNWVDRVTGAPLFFEQGYPVLFDDLALGTNWVALNTNVSAGGVVVSNSTINYTIAGTGSFQGVLGLTKQGTGSLTLSTPNNAYTGPTIIDEGGTLVSTVANNLGTNSVLTIGTGTLSLGANNQRFATVTMTNGSILASGATVTARSYTLDNGTVSAALAGGGVTTFGTNTDLVSLYGANTYTGATVLAGSVLQVTNLANGGTASGVGASSSNPTNLVFAGGALTYAGPAATTDRGYAVSGGGTFSVAGNLALAGAVASSGGTFVKSGPAALAYTRPGTNLINAGAYYIGQGTVVFNGGASTPANYLQTNRVNNDIWVGFDQVNAGALIVTNTTLGINNWLALDRGNGTNGSSSRVTFYDSVVTAGNMSMGYANGIAGNSSFSVFNMLGNSSFTVGGRTFVGESAGANATVVVAGNTRWTQNGEWFAIGSAGKGTMTLSNYARVSFPGDYNLGDVGGADGTLNIYDNATNLALTLYVGKGNDAGPATGVVNQYGGYVGKSASGGGDWRIGGNSSTTTAASVGTYNLYGGVYEPQNNFQIGAWGTGTWNQTGGTATCGSYPVVGRFVGSTGTLNISAGSFTQTGTGQLLIIGEEGNGTLNISGTAVVTSMGGVSVGHSTTGEGTVNLNGGMLVAPRVASYNNNASNSVFNFNGGVLQANANRTDFMMSMSNAFVLARGAIIDSASYNINIAQPLLTDLVSLGGGLTKLGAGMLTLSGVNTYTGLTVVSNGTLAVNGSIAGSATAKAGGTIGGNGTIPGTVTVEAGGAIGAGAGGIGSLTLGASPVLNGTVVAELDRNAGSPLADLITVSGGAIAYNGTLNLVNVGAPLQVNDTFKLFQATGYSGSFTLLANTPGQIVTWDVSQLAVNGTVRVAAAVGSPVSITATVIGNNLQLWWPTNTTGWRLETQTNAITIGISNNWTPVPGSTTVNAVLIPLDSANPSVFYRMVYP